MSTNTFVHEYDRPPRTAILFDFEVSQSVLTSGHLRGIANGLVNAWNKEVIFSYQGLAGWANDPNSGDMSNDRPLQDAPTDPTATIWNNLYTALDNQIGINAWYLYEETITQEVIFVGDIEAISEGPEPQLTQLSPP